MDKTLSTAIFNPGCLVFTLYIQTLHQNQKKLFSVTILWCYTWAALGFSRKKTFLKRPQKIFRFCTLTPVEVLEQIFTPRNYTKLLETSDKFQGLKQRSLCFWHKNTSPLCISSILLEVPYTHLTHLCLFVFSGIEHLGTVDK